MDRARKGKRTDEIPPRARPKILDTLDLTEEFQRLLDEGVVNNRAEIARQYDISRARVTQVLSLLKLHPAIMKKERDLARESPAHMVPSRSRSCLELLQSLSLGEEDGSCSDVSIHSFADERWSPFLMRSGLAIYGGFAGT